MLAMAFLVLAFCALTTPTASAQPWNCVLALDVATTNTKFETRPINDARATALNTGSHKSMPAVLMSGQPVFSNLIDGRYRITVTRPGFKRAVQPVTFKCERMNGQATMRIDLERGSVRQLVIARSLSINASETSRLPPVIRGVANKNDLDRTERVAKQVPPPPPPNVPRAPVSGGVLNGKALVLPRPPYPPIARQAHASGTVVVQVTIDEEGNIISAHAVSGHPLLQGACVQAARNAKFSPTKLAGQPVKVTGVITYNFVAE